MSIAMALDACALTDVHVQLDVGRGVAAVELRARVASEVACAIDFAPVLQAREAGREAPTIVVWSIDLDGATTLGGPSSPPRLDARGPSRLVARAILRGERFVVSTASPGPKSRITFDVSSVWGTETIPARARWIDAGVPKLVEADVEKTKRESTGVLEGEQALVVDAGPSLGGDGGHRNELDFEREIAGGGVAMISALMTELPVAIVDARDDAEAIAWVRFSARAALAASRSSEPLVRGVGQQLASAIERGYLGCDRDEGMMPAKWPATDPSFRTSGLLTSASSGCANVGGLAERAHANVAFAREGAAALVEATMAGETDRLHVGRLFGAHLRTVAVAARSRFSGRIAARIAIALLAVAVALTVAVELVGARARRRSANRARGIP
jgi:hypothetical protein